MQDINMNPDKVRIMTLLVNRIYPRMLYDPEWVRKQHDDQPGFLYKKEGFEIKPGDLVTGMTSLWYNDFIVGFVQEVHDDGSLLIREIGSDRTCNYSNERFIRIDKDLLGNEALEGKEYALYQKTLKAFSEFYSFKFAGIKFDKNKVFLSGRKIFSEDVAFTVEFYYNSKTSIKSIKTLIETEIEKVRKNADKTDSN